MRIRIRRTGLLLSLVLVSICLGRGQGVPDGAVVAARAKIRQAAAYREAGDYVKAEALAGAALEAFEKEKGKEHPVGAELLRERALALARLGELRKAAPLYRRALLIQMKKFGRFSPEVVATLSDRADLTLQAGFYEIAEPQLLECRKTLTDKLGAGHVSLAPVLERLANFYRALGQHGQAEKYYHQSLALYRKHLGAESLPALRCLGSQAVLFRQTGRYARAEQDLLEVLRKLEAKFGAEHPDVARNLHRLGEVYGAMGLGDRAKARLERAWKIRKAKLGEKHVATARTALALGKLLSDRGQHRLAARLYAPALRVLAERLPPYHDELNRGLILGGNLWLHAGRLDRAANMYKLALPKLKVRLGVDHPDVANALHGLALIHQDGGRPALAEKTQQQALDILIDQLGRDHPDTARSQQDLAILHMTQGRWSKAVAAIDQGRRSLRQHASRVLPALAEVDQMTFLRVRDTPALHVALSLGLARAGHGLAGMSAGWVLNGKATVHQALAERALLSRDSRNPALVKLVLELQGVRGELARLVYGGLPADARTDRATLIRQLTGRESDLSRRLGQAAGRPRRADSWITLAEVRSALPPDAVLVEIARFNVLDPRKKVSEKRWQAPRYAVWVIPPAGLGEVALIDLGEAAVIEQAVERVRAALHKAPDLIREEGEPDAEARMRKPLEELSRLVLHPLHAQLKRYPRWLVSPDAALWLVPWAALPLPDGAYAVEKHTLSTLISGRDLVLPNSAGKTTPALVLADPDFDLAPASLVAEARRLHLTKSSGTLRGTAPSGKLPPFERLSATAAEARAIRPSLKRYLGNEPVYRLRRQALEAVVKSCRSPRVLALSTHGFFLEGKGEGAAGSENPLLRCGLALAGVNRREHLANSPTDDGILTGLEVVGTDLGGTELVVLSACETGVGRVEIGEGVAGLRQAFHLAGAHAVLASLWQVDDLDTARLMARFFDRLAAGRDRETALREAQLTILHARRGRDGAGHPFYWAAFSLTAHGPMALGRPFDRAGLVAEIKRLGGVALPHPSDPKQVRWIDLEHTDLNDGWLVNLRGQTKLQTLLLRDSRVGDAGLAPLAGLTNLRELDLRGTRVTDAGLVHLKGLRHLRSLKLSGHITGVGLAHLKALPALEVLSAGSGLGEAGLKLLKEFPRLRELHLRGAGLTDESLVHLKDCKNLEVLSLSHNRISSKGLVYLTGLTRLRWLSLEYTPCTDDIIKPLKELKNLRYLDLFLTHVSRGGVGRLEKEVPGLQIKTAPANFTELILATYRQATLPTENKLGASFEQIKAHTGSVVTLAFSPDSKLLATGGGTSSSGEVKLLDTTTKKVRTALIGHRAMVRALAFSPDGKLLASGSEAAPLLLVWEVASGKERVRGGGLTGPIHALAFSPDGKTLAVADGDKVRLLTAASFKEIRFFTAHVGGVRCLAWSPDGKTLVTGGDDKRVRLWNPTTGKQTGSMVREGVVRCLAFSPDGKTLAIAAGKFITLWDFQRQVERLSRQAHRRDIQSIAFTPDGLNLVLKVLGDKEGFRAWNVATLTRIRSSNYPGNCLAVSRKGDLAIGGWFDRDVFLFLGGKWK